MLWLRTQSTAEIKKEPGGRRKEKTKKKHDKKKKKKIQEERGKVGEIGVVFVQRSNPPPVPPPPVFVHREGREPSHGVDGLPGKNASREKVLLCLKYQ